MNVLAGGCEERSNSNLSGELVLRDEDQETSSSRMAVGPTENVVPVDHVEEVINRVMVDLEQVLHEPEGPERTYITKEDLERSLQMMKLQIVTEISSEVRSLTPLIAMSLTNLALTNNPTEDLFSYKQQIVRRDLVRQHSPDVKENSEFWPHSQQSPSLQERKDYRESYQNDFWPADNPTPETGDIYQNPDSNRVNENLAESINLKDKMESDFWEHGDPSPPPRVNSELSILAADDDTTVASDVLDNDQSETHYYVQDNEGEEEKEKKDEDHFNNNSEMCSQSPNMTSRSNSSAKSMVTAKQRSNDETPMSKTEFKLDLAQEEEEEDISQLIDNDEDALTDDLSSLRSPRVNYLTGQPSASHSSFLRRQRLTTASTLDIPQGVEEEEEEEDRTDNTYVRPSSPRGTEDPVSRLEVPGPGPGPKQSLVMQTLLTNYRPVQQGWLAKKVLGAGKKPFYDRRPQSRIRINSTAHQGFCGMCGPCSCNNSTRNSASVRRDAVRLRVDTWWRKPTIPQKFRTNQPRGVGAGRHTEKKIVEEDVVD